MISVDSILLAILVKHNLLLMLAILKREC